MIPSTKKKTHTHTHTHTHTRVGRVGSHSWSTEYLGFMRFAKRHQALTKKKTQLHDHSTMEHKNKLKFQNSVFQNKFTHTKYPHIENYICLSPTVFIVFLPIEIQRRLKQTKVYCTFFILPEKKWLKNL